jgi:hypothetical protein
MGEWIYRPSIQQDWVTLIYFFNILIISGMYYVNASRIKTFIKINFFGVYGSKFADDKNLNHFNLFNVFSFLVILNSIGLMSLWIFKKNHTSLNYAFEYYYFIFVLFTILIVRFLTVIFLMKSLNLQKKTKEYFFKSFTCNTQFSIFSSTLLLVANYSQINSILINIILGILFITWAISQSIIIFSFIQSNHKDFFYLIVYLCTIKIAPWFWLYFIFIEPIF